MTKQLSQQVDLQLDLQDPQDLQGDRQKDQRKDQQQDQQPQSLDINVLDAKKVLLQHPNLWRAGQLAHGQGQKGIATGYAQLDEHLPSHGWPAGGLMEFMLASAGIGELRLLVPALQALSHAESRWVAWINPPFIPYAPALQAAGIDISKILLIHPRSHKDALWALERACKSGSCSTALAWLDERKLKLKDTQRLQLAAKQGGTLACLFRPQTALTQSSMAELRLALRTTTPGEIQLDIVKRRGGWPLHNLLLPVAETTATTHHDAADIQQQLDIWRAFQQHKTPVDENAMDPLFHINTQSVGSTVRVH